MWNSKFAELKIDRLNPTKGLNWRMKMNCFELKVNFFGLKMDCSRQRNHILQQWQNYSFELKTDFSVFDMDFFDLKMYFFEWKMDFSELDMDFSAL